VTTVAIGEMFSVLDIPVNNDASLVSGSQFIISLTSVQLHTGQLIGDLLSASVTREI